MESATERRMQCEDGTALRVRVAQAPAPAPKGWIIVVHGLDDHLDRYAALARFLQESGYEVVLYDQRGHGRSEGARTHVAGFGKYVEDLERLREELQRERGGAPHLFGHSMGSVVALLAALRHPEHWRSVIVQGFPSLPGRNIPKALEALVRALGPLVSRLRVSSGIAPAELARDARVGEAYSSDPLVQGNVTLGWGAEFLAALRKLDQGASAITCPLLILHGENDTIARPEGARRLARQADAAERKLVTYPGLKHELHNESERDRAPVFAEIRAWLDRH